MRLRNVKNKDEILNASLYLVKNPEENKGKWKEVLKRDSLHVEIGTGKGDYWITMSEMYPEIGWIGVEKNESVAAMAVRKSGERVENRLFVQNDAANIDTWFAAGEVDVIHLNFSDSRLSVAKLAEDAGFSEVYFRKLFALRFGQIQLLTLAIVADFVFVRFLDLARLAK
jgi:hypothetical protein